MGVLSLARVSGYLSRICASQRGLNRENRESER